MRLLSHIDTIYVELIYRRVYVDLTRMTSRSSKSDRLKVATLSIEAQTQLHNFIHGVIMPDGPSTSRIQLDRAFCEEQREQKIFGTYKQTDVGLKPNSETLCISGSRVTSISKLLGRFVVYAKLPTKFLYRNLQPGTLTHEARACISTGPVHSVGSCHDYTDGRILDLVIPSTHGGSKKVWQIRPSCFACGWRDCDLAAKFTKFIESILRNPFDMLLIVNNPDQAYSWFGLSIAFQLKNS